MKITTILQLGLIFLTTPLFALEKINVREIERGRYLVKITGCNDCHTPGYGQQGGQAPEKDWLIGDGVGFKGPWGVTYPANIRARIESMSAQDFVKYAKVMRSRPPMPWYSLNAMSDRDLISLYRFIVYLGPSKNTVPQSLPPGVKPQTPYMDMTVTAP
jgi:mono/diheme cytochrome c family protein